MFVIYYPGNPQYIPLIHDMIRYPVLMFKYIYIYIYIYINDDMYIIMYIRIYIYKHIILSYNISPKFLYLMPMVTSVTWPRGPSSRQIFCTQSKTPV